MARVIWSHEEVTQCLDLDVVFSLVDVLLFELVVLP